MQICIAYRFNYIIKLSLFYLLKEFAKQMGNDKMMMDRSLMPALNIECNIAEKNLPVPVQRVKLLYQWFRTTPVVESGNLMVCR